ncbi:MAG: BamA/TamA family outer membrane protein [Thalassococcus sp.]|uniref:BamA/TamA family outer membrane protein n=1 Tax=Thalassococcus sp. TaxID=1928858 RepID=UPI001B2C650B|nr:BamA/TamA family outer membrane protein [Thalassococcus sp.]MBO6868118.1 BamA/TamA family outer membrane protein [Thalassococcus sp.]
MGFVSKSFITCAALVGLSLPVFAAEGALVAGVSFSNRYGATGNLGLEFNDLFNETTQARLGFRSGENGEEWSAGLSTVYGLGETGLGRETSLQFGLKASVSDWDVNPYQTENYEFNFGVGGNPTEMLSWYAGAFFRHDSLNNADDGLSAIIVDDLGSSEAYGLEAQLTWSDKDRAEVLQTGSVLSLGIATTFSNEDYRDWSSYNVRGETTVAAFGQSVLFVGLGGGAVQSKSDENRIHVLDRIFSNSDLPRGFAWGATGPIDPVTDDALGGTRYVAGTVELMAPLPRPGMAVGAFVDAGSVWDLGDLASDGVIDDDYDLRSSTGLSLIWSSNHGRLRASVAEPISYNDDDDLERFSFQFTASF